MVTRFGELGWRTPALLALGIAYALVAAATTPFTCQADLMTAIPIAALAIGAVVCWPAHPTIASKARHRPRYWPWLVALAAVVTWELVSESLPGSRGDHPTLSSMLNAVDRQYGLKFVVFLGWLTLGWAVVQLGRSARR